MTDEEYKQLETLLGKLGQILKANYCIVPGVIQDGYNIAIYDSKGEMFVQDSWVDIKSTAARVLERAENKKKEIMEAKKEKDSTFMSRLLK